MPPRLISRRSALAACAGASAACSRNKATAFPGYAFIANQTGRSVAAVDLTHFRVERRLPLDAAPSAIVAHPKHARVYALAPENGTLYEIDGRELAVRRRARAGSAALAVRLSPSADSLWVASRNPAQLVEIPFDSMAPRRRIALPWPPDDFDISRDGLAAVASQSARSIALAALGPSNIVRQLSLADEPSIVRFQSDGRQLLAGSRADRSVTIYDVASGRTVVRLPVPVEPRNFCFTGDGGQLFVTGPGMDGVVIVFPYDTEIGETILAGRTPDSMAVSETPPYLLVTNPESDTVTVLDIETRRLMAVLHVGREPRHVSITPDRQYALVLNHRSGDLAVIRLAPLAARRWRWPAAVFTMIPVGEGPVAAAVVATNA